MKYLEGEGNDGSSLYVTDDEWDAVHQMIYRNFHASQLEPADLPLNTHVLPAEPSPIKKTWPSESGEVGSVDYPSIAAFLRHQPNQSTDLYIALYEDTYETSSGDGEFHYFKKVFTDKSSAQAYIDDHTDGWKRWYLRTLLVKCVGSRLTWTGY